MWVEIRRRAFETFIGNDVYGSKQFDGYCRLLEDMQGFSFAEAGLAVGGAEQYTSISDHGFRIIVNV